MSSWKPAGTGRSPSSDAATIIPLRLDAAQLSRLEIGHDHDLAADELFRLISFCDACDDGARLGLADIHLQVKQFVRALHRLGVFSLGPRGDPP